MTDPELLDALIEAAEKATPGPWTAGNADLDNLIEPMPAMIRHIYEDEKGSRVTEYLMTGNTLPTLPSNANMRFVAAARNATDAIKRMMERDKAAETVTRFYFEIAAEALGEERVRELFTKRLNEECALRRELEKEDD